jgi:enamine deaminase RidA (YjgF/YER057c/UK114 family)
VLAHIDRLLAEAGSDKTCILSCQIYIADWPISPA